MLYHIRSEAPFVSLRLLTGSIEIPSRVSPPPDEKRDQLKKDVVIHSISISYFLDLSERLV